MGLSCCIIAYHAYIKYYKFFWIARDHFVYFNLSSHLRREAHFGMKWVLGEVLAVSGHFMEVKYSIMDTGI
jgi:hypothetical protein